MMRVRPPGGRLQHHRYRADVWSAGNLWALDRPINNSASNRLPAAKFDLLAHLPTAGLSTLWPTEGFLTAEERGCLLAAQDLIQAGAVDDGMELFHTFARGRSQRLHAAVFTALPAASAFGAVGAMVAEFEPPVVVEVARALGLGTLPSVTT